MMSESLHLPVVDPSQAGEARRLAGAWAGQRCSKEHTAKVALVASELARNLALHTTNGGFLLLRMLEGRAEAVEVMSLDQGPGKANFGSCMRDGFSTTGTSGTGLGAVQRASEFFQFHSLPGIGTAILSHICAKPPATSPKYHVGVANVPKPGQDVCGDSYGYCDLGNGRIRLVVADGLGHGPIAAAASALAVKVFQTERHLDLQGVLQSMHDALRATRGAAVAIAEIDPVGERVSYAGVGNIAGSIVRQEAASHLVSCNGTIGAVLPRLQTFSYPWSRDAILVMSSDGLKSHWRMDRYAGLLQKHPSLMAAILFRDHARHTDDTTVATLRPVYEHRAAEI